LQLLTLPTGLANDIGFLRINCISCYGHRIKKGDSCCAVNLAESKCEREKGIEGKE
jgi:hypothetical protein